MPFHNGIHYQVAGDGPGVLLLAGTGAYGRTWHLHQRPALVAAGYRVVTYDTRGLVPSEVPEAVTMPDLVADAAGLIEHLGLGPCRVAGSSMGARTAAELCLRHPELVDRLVLMASFDRPGAFLNAKALAESKAAELPAEYEAVVRAAFNLSPRTLADDRKAQDWLDVFQMPLTGGGGPVSRLEAGQDDDRLRAYGEIAVPCLVVSFADDLIAPPPGGRRIAGVVAGARYIEIPDAGHYGYLEQPDRVNAALIHFFEESA
ncbi:alpha/beta fold hydrolase [Actinoplanes sp. LDG1-06]|uniref:Alpha/beta fold hydrolase n=1 Tax=Paractinoplanes ovalisporus TaxID=2810368 RepID=A0ABS2AA19_9ACTN|nr:alpha/beta fold hydrolase [Actinoplanes ovalisporus]MBM2616679.1 alpha/beta fold hydrolase [Actinoplanes ovalisporus]